MVFSQTRKEMMFDFDDQELDKSREALSEKISITKQKRLSLEEKIANLEAEQVQLQEKAKQKLNSLKVKQQKLESKSKDQERKDDTRRKILLGAWVLNKLNKNPDFKNQLADFSSFLEQDSKTGRNQSASEESKKRAEATMRKKVELFKGILWDK